MKYNFINKFQEGGPAPAPAPEAAAPQGGEDPMAMLLQGAAQAVQNGDCNTAMQVCQMLMELAQGGAQEAAPAPAEAPAAGEPTMQRQGGKLVLVRRNG